MHKTCFFIKLKPLALKDDHNCAEKVESPAYLSATNMQRNGWDIYVLVFCMVHCAFNSCAEGLIIFQTFYILIVVL